MIYYWRMAQEKFKAEMHKRREVKEWVRWKRVSGGRGASGERPRLQEGKELVVEVCLMNDRVKKCVFVNLECVN